MLKRFERWKHEEIKLTFGMQRVSELQTLTSWQKMKLTFEVG